MGFVLLVSLSDAKVSVINFGSEPATLNAQTALGTCESFDECSDGPRIARVTEQEPCQSLPSHLTELFERSTVHLN